ncbi:Predicted dehydrogenase and related protein [Roseibium aggregatum IAM 12614]|uniref:Predicted dehydrogenase and related protein n=1 Tax=Roseibium aggregatum (strain ATCC 25650 / DSM 13394 / JCM 20685 / NBRC 16684 / NCIMB 2208 / IAM 12614 / B1) TaxID=384765 RepID=A0NPJ9_ROSAI|nr:Gfo/Idh/MocA family oxidoreductase [Roseibium aggregatum]EAV45362.1 Predicted dehydrogenase and related protein [Roseibium aggregatum IAM 12614]
MTDVGLVGFGRWGKLIFRDLRNLGVPVHVAVPGSDSRKAALEAGAASVCESVADLPDCTGYVVAPPTVHHAACIDALASRNRPIFCEKPLTNDARAAQQLADTLKERLFVMDKWRYHPGILKLAELAKSGELGQIEAVRTYRLGWGNPHKDVDSLWILITHDLSIALEILGTLPKACSAISQIPGMGGEDMIAHLQNDGEPLTVTMEISSLHPFPTRSVVVIGSKAVAQLASSYDDRILLAPRDNSRKPQQIEVGTKMPLLAELEAFLAHLNGGPAPKSSAAEGALIVKRIAELRALAGLP